LPSVVARAAAAGAPIERYGGDFLADPLPPGADLISFVRVLHDHDDADVLRLLRAAFAALAPGGRILIAEPMTGRGRFAGAYLGMYLLAMGRGRPRRPRELQTLAGSAGFRGFKMLRTRTPSLLQIAIADRGK
jgi:demethylspheroidene O-methyltransferase